MPAQGGPAGACAARAAAKISAVFGVVWFKRDLRVADHAALSAAAAAGPVLPLYVVEPALWRLPDASARQWLFLRGALADLAAELARLGAPLVVRVGEVTEVLSALRDRHGPFTLFSHEETGNLWTYARDRRVAAWCRAHGITWREYPQAAVWRRMPDRDAWAGFHARFMGEAPHPAPLRLTPMPEDPGAIPPWPGAPLAEEGLLRLQPPGRAQGLALLESFLAGRGADYRRGMSSPLTAARVCSRLSPHLAVGSLSVREVRQRIEAARAAAAVPAGSIESLLSRLAWRDHFIQKLESEPTLEQRAMHPLMEAARRPTAPDDPLLLAWAEGRTGLPFLDACMRSLIATGWLTFRMRAMAMAVAAYHLGLDWQAAGQRLARLFTDYEPGIHWPQVQMQSGATGINTPRIYNPIKQGLDHDPEGRFIARWLPELAALPPAVRHTPWRFGAAPPPVIDPQAAAAAAKERLARIRRHPDFLPLAREVYRRHGSRARSFGRDMPRPQNPRQGVLAL
ncbi:MAG: deoxyribodipyrimidine photo-lyase [Rhodovarius sp.]|nr:deoxyribodipyrimidine photo-lyase [Rhodovarius sp.]